MELETGLCFGGMLIGEIRMSAFPFALVEGGSRLLSNN